MTVSPITTSRVQSAIAAASSKTGIDFSYLLGQAKLESGLQTNARAATSSASGLYQFIERSWLSVVKQHGAEHGLGWAANAITTTNGRPTVADPAMRQAILALRNNPDAASLMAAEHASDNKTALETTLGRPATGTDLYMAHFLGLGGAKKFLGALQSSPGQSAAALFPAAAGANRGVFYASNGQPRSLSDVYSRFAAKLGAGAGDSGTVTETAAANMMAARSFDMDDATVIAGGNESTHDAMAWASAALGKFRTGATPQQTAANLMRPTPDTARLAYMMLASMGG
ncbi:lytic transglycosylase domain-containing protein [Sphingomonas sp. PB2P19]|uniref:lytic transglycosylase domain-containing protein n=1 Tax=Sphingomonas rhamnosi TaxID=3096156 RepID=UPI002FC73D41